MNAVFIFLPNKFFVPGGVYGLGIVLHALFPSIQVGTFGLMFDIPLLLIAFWVFGGMFGARTIVSALIIPLAMNAMTALVGENPATMLGGEIDLSDDMLLACIFGGVITGAGTGLVIKAKSTTGGTDIVAMLLTRYARMNFSRGILLVDSIVVVFGMIVLGDWRLPLYSLITIFVISRVINFVLEGANSEKLLFIISDKHEALRDYIVNEIGRGGTYLKASGIYTRKDKEMIFVVVSRRQVSAVQDKIKEIDPLCFVVVVNAHETIGDGFKPFTDSPAGSPM